MRKPTAVNPHPGRVAGGQKGALRSWALTPDRTARTQPARDARMARYVAQVRDALPDLSDEADIMRRAEMLRRADMIELSRLAAQARKLKAEMRALENSLGDGPA